MSGQNYFNSSPIGEWNGPPSNTNGHVQNGYGMTTDASIGVFQSPPTSYGQYTSAPMMANNTTPDVYNQPPGFSSAQNNMPFGNYAAGDGMTAFRPAYGNPGAHPDSQGVAAALARVAQGLATQQQQVPPRSTEMSNGFAHMNGTAQPAMNGFAVSPRAMNGATTNGMHAQSMANVMNGGHMNGMGPYGDSQMHLKQPMPFDNAHNTSSSSSLPTLPTSVSDPMLYQQLQQAQNSNSGINFENYDAIPVTVKGENAPDPIAMFRDAAFNHYVQLNIDLSRYLKPTPVQKHAIPTLMAGRDMMACAQTGSGKTAAFLLPIINKLLSVGIMPYKEMNPTTRRLKQFPLALILSPTRELAMQIHKEATKFSFNTPIMTVMFYGGRENYRDQLNKSRNGCHIVIATPGRLIDIVNQGYMSLEHCKYLVLDEADRMLDMGFEPQIRKIVSLGLPGKMQRQTAMFSATFPNEIKKLAEDFLNPNFVHLAVGRVGSTSENIEQHVLWMDETDKRGHLQRLLDGEDPMALVLVFVETRRAANDLANQLVRSGLRAVAIHGDLKQLDRERNLEMFRNGSNPVLVATAVAARGLDIPNVKHVINYDMPNDVDEYVHRIGRTGRCGNAGTASSFFTEKNRVLARDLLAVLNESNQGVPDWLPPLAATSHNMRNPKFTRGRGRGMANGFSGPTRGVGLRGSFNTGAPRGGRPNGINGTMMPPMGGYGFPQGAGPFPGGPFPPANNFNPMHNGFGAPGPFGMNAPGGNRGGFRGGANNFNGGNGRGSMGPKPPMPFHGGMPPMFGGMRPPMPGMEWQQRTTPVPN